MAWHAPAATQSSWHSVVRAEDTTDEDADTDTKASADESSGDDDDSYDTDVDTNKSPSTEAEGISSRAILVGHNMEAQPTLTAGTDVDAIVGLSSSAESSGLSTTYRIEYVLAYLSFRETGYFVQNFTGAQYSRTVSPGETVSVRYRFQPDASLESRDYNLMMQVFYMSEDNETYLATPFNGTVTIVDNSLSFLDGRTLFAYGSVIGIIAMLGGAAYTKVFGSGSSASPSGGRAKALKTTDGIDWDYVAKEHRQYVRARSHTPKKSASPSPPTNKK